MPALYLLDTNTLSNLTRQPQGRVSERIAQVGEANVVTCELRYGHETGLLATDEAGRGTTRRPGRSRSRVDVERVYAAIRVALEKKDTPIGAHDMLIAAHARATDAGCVTDNVAEFK